MATAGQLRTAGVYVPPHIPDHDEVALTVPLSEKDVDRLARRFVDVLPAVERLPQISCDIEGVMRLLACKSKSAAYRELEKLRVKPYAMGKYFVREITERVARLSYQAQPKPEKKPAPAETSQQAA